MARSRMQAKRLTIAILVSATLSCSDHDLLQPPATGPQAIEPVFSVSGGATVDLEGFGGTAAINDNGQIVGLVSTDGGRTTSAFLWTPSAPGATTGTMVDLGAGLNAVASGVNMDGWISGSRDPPFEVRAGFVWIPSSPGATTGTIHHLPHFGSATSSATFSEAYDINDNGEVVGMSRGHPVLWRLDADGNPPPLGSTIGLTTVPRGLEAYAINNAGQIVGGPGIGDTGHAFLWAPSAPGATSGTMVDLGTLPGGPFSVAQDINNSGQIVGWSSTASGEVHPFLWTPSAPGSTEGTMVDLGTLPGATGGRATGINDAGQIVGLMVLCRSLTRHAFLWTPSEPGAATGTMTDLGPRGSSLADPPRGGPAINNDGQVVASVPGFPSRMVLWTDHSGITNHCPVADHGGPYSGTEGAALSFIGSGASDPDGDALSYEWRFGDQGSASGVTASHVYADNGSFTVELRVSDGDLGDFVTTTAQIANVAPNGTLVASPSSLDEGGNFGLQLTNTSDPSPADAAAGFRYSFDCGDGGGFGALAGASSATCTTVDEGVRTVGGRVADKDGDQSEHTAVVSVNNVAPAVGPIAAPLDPVAVGTSVSASASFTDPGVLDTHTAQVDWDAAGASTVGAATVTEANGSGSATGTHAYTMAGVYTLELMVTDDDGGAGASLFQFVVAYDPSAGFVTGGGWIYSEPGFCQLHQACADASGKASFGFISKYHRGAAMPSGNTEFEFRAGGLHFKSTAYQWLVISGPKAQYKGSGTINGAGDYGFLLTTNDGQVSGGGGVDRFRIKIWDKLSDVVVYDNQAGDGDDAAAATVLGGGNIVIHAR